jgi:hypothetical protein
MKRIATLMVAGLLTGSVSSLALAQGGATGGTGGAAAVGGTSASTLGVGAASGDSSSLGVGGSAAGGSQQKVNGNVSGGGNSGNLNGHVNAKAQDGGTWSKSKTHTKVHNGEVSSRTKTMAHEPGGPPVKSTTGMSTGQ